MSNFDRRKINFLPLATRKNKLNIEDLIRDLNNFDNLKDSRITKIAETIIESRKNQREVILTFGAHVIRNGLGVILQGLISEGYVTHLATNGAGSIHDWEIAFQGKTTEDVRKYLEEGKFGLWEETGKYINLALIVGSREERGYGESIGKMICNNGLTICKELAVENEKLKDLNISKKIKIEHPFKRYSIHQTAFELKIPFTVHPCFGQDIIYCHNLCDGSSIGKTAEIDFLKFTDSISKLEEGVYLSIGSSIMSPMIFEKSLSMARNVAFQEGKKIRDFMIVVNDIQEENWNFGSKEPEKDNPSYYLRFCKTFDRAGSREMHYIKADNKKFLISLYNELRRLS